MLPLSSLLAQEVRAFISSLICTRSPVTCKNFPPQKPDVSKVERVNSVLTVTIYMTGGAGSNPHQARSSNCCLEKTPGSVTIGEWVLQIMRTKRLLVRNSSSSGA